MSETVNLQLVRVRWVRSIAYGEYRSAIGVIKRTTSTYWSVELFGGQRHPFGCRTLADAKNAAVREANAFGGKKS